MKRSHLATREPKDEHAKKIVIGLDKYQTDTLHH